MFLHMVSIGLGLVAPLGNLANIAPMAKEIKITYQFQAFPKLEYKLINLTRDELNIDIFQITEGGTIKLYKKIYLSLGLGAYHIRETASAGEEWSSGFCSYYGVIIPYEFSKSKLISPEIAYYTVPRGISFTLNFGIRLWKNYPK